ncbi:translocation/assembly module TamB [Marivirga sp. S37H4]|uniref:Translocation/assembly module TamB n=1 Tax=Marivirga aurantiaca TaxID=2802615 RepID=A0A935CBE0_9BACT|nr:translocation/assembly module TamB domain-containing protein [Marivirga aurantiaca]MBK6266727.1 translocation/assembly module TamB [Marivirga aurantiaca]
MKKFGKIVLYTFSILLLLLIVILLLLRLPVVQQKITDYATDFVSEKTNTEVKIDKLYISFLGEAIVEGLYVEDQQQDTLIYSESLLVDMAWRPMLLGKYILKNLELEGLRANVHNSPQDTTFNYQFIIDAFAGENEEPPKEEKQKESNTTFKVRDVDLEDIALTYSDYTIGLNTSLQLGKLEIAMDEFDLDSLIFSVDNLNLSNVVLNYSQKQEFAETEESQDTTGLLPHITIEDLQLQDIAINYETKFDSMSISALWKELALKESGIDLNKNHVFVESFLNEQEYFHFQMAESTGTQDTTSTSDSSESFDWPDWNIQINQFDFNIADLSFHQGQKPENRQGFNAAHMEFQDLSLELEELNYKQKLLDLNSIGLSVKDSNQFQLKELTTGIAFDQNQVVISDFVLRTNQSVFETNLVLNYEELDSLMQGSLYGSDVDLKIGLGTQINLTDAYYFAPELRTDTSFRDLAKHPFKLYGNIEGSTEQMNLSQIKLFYGQHFSLAINGRAEQILSTENLSVFLDNINLKGRTSDFKGFLPSDYPSHYPQKLQMTGQASWDKGKARADLRTVIDDISKIRLSGNFNMNEPKNYNLKLNGEDLALDKWLQDTATYKPVDLMLTVKGQGIELANIKAEADLKIDNLSYLQNDFKPIELHAELIDNEVSLHTEYTNSVLDFMLDVSGNIDSLDQSIRVATKIKRMNLLAFGIADSLAYLQMNAFANLRMNENEQFADLKINNFSFGTEEEAYPFNDLQFNLYNSPDSSMINLNWEEIAFNTHINQSLEVLSNIDFSLGSLLAMQLFEEDTTSQGLYVDFKLDAALSNNIENFLPFDLHFEPLLLVGEYSAQDEALEIFLDMPMLTFQDIKIDSLQVDIVSDAENLEATTTINRITSGIMDIYPTRLRATVSEQQAVFNFYMQDEEEDSLFHVSAEARNNNDSLVWNISPQNLILNGGDWNLDENNQLYFDKEAPMIRNLAFERNQQLFSLSTESGETTAMLFNFENFKIQNFFAIINAEESPLKGVLKGEVKMDDFTQPLNLYASLNLNDIKVLQEDAGNLYLDVKEESAGRYALNLNINGPLNMDNKGWFDTSSDTLQFEMASKINELSLPFITTFTEGLIKEAEGALTGNFDINGTPSDFTYSGKLQFQKASLLLTDLNTSFGLPNETITLEKEKIALNNFTLVDRQGQKMQLNGTILTDDFTDPEIDLQVNAKNFQLMNSTKEDNELFYGKAFVDINADWKGRVSNAKISATVSLNEDTDFSYVIPDSEVDMVEREGIVEFKSPYEPADTVKNEEEVQSTQLSGMEITANIKTDKNAAFNIIVDERRGDYLTVSGEADLLLNLRKNGTLTLSGNYLVNSGFYQLSLYDLVKRKFEIKSGSEISWTGDPMGASLDITAQYNVETAPNSLMEDQISGSATQVQNRYRQKLPFIVQLFVDGSISKPEISFGLDMPQNSRGAIGGTVYQQIQAINENETRLNKQVFSLLVLNQFFPAGSESSGPDSEAIARNSASQILSNQLNKLSDRYIKGVDLEMDLKSYEDYETGTAQDRTQLDVSLSKSLFDDRFRVKVGSQVDLEGEQRERQSATDVLGNVLVEYLLTEDGRYMLTGFRRNEFEGLLDGQVIVTGVSVKFTKEFDKLSELWSKEEELDEPENTEEVEENE